MDNTSRAMEGFDPAYPDPPSYILGVTKLIWEDRAVHTLREHYAKDMIVRSPPGVLYGNEAVIAATLSTLAEFPDRELLGEDVIWCATEGGGFLSSHRLYSTATHLGSGVYGDGGGTRVRYRIIADCATRNNVMYDEWLIRDQGAIVRQLGMHPKDYAASRVQLAGGFDRLPEPLGPDNNPPGVYQGTTNDHEFGNACANLLNELMEGHLDLVRTEFDRAVQLELPGGRTEYGWGAADAFWLGLRAALPDAQFHVEHVIGMDEPHQPQRSAIRWSLAGHHTGSGAFGPATGAPVFVLGLTHTEGGPRGHRRQFTVFDETAIWHQILRHQG